LLKLLLSLLEFIPVLLPFFIRNFFSIIWIFCSFFFGYRLSFFLLSFLERCNPRLKIVLFSFLLLLLFLLMFWLSLLLIL
jgi:hypothetical protein